MLRYMCRFGNNEPDYGDIYSCVSCGDSSPACFVELFVNATAYIRVQKLLLRVGQNHRLYKLLYPEFIIIHFEYKTRGSLYFQSAIHIDFNYPLKQYLR